MSALPNATSPAGERELVDDVWRQKDSGDLFTLVYDHQACRLTEISIEKDDSCPAPYDVVERGGPYKVYWVGYRSFEAAMMAAEGRRAEIEARTPRMSVTTQDVGGPAKAALYMFERPKGG